MIRKSFTLRVLVIVFIFLAIPLLIDTFIFFRTSYVTNIENSRDAFREIADLRAYSLEETRPVKQVLLKEMIYFLQVEGKEKTNEILNSLGGDSQLFLLEEAQPGHFRFLASTDEFLVGKEMVSYFQLEKILKEGSGTFLRYAYDHETKDYQYFVFVARKIEGTENQILLAGANIHEEIENLLAKQEGFEDIGFALLDGDSIVIAASDEKLMGQYFKPITPQRRKQILKSEQLGPIKLAEKPLSVIQHDDPSYKEFVFEDQLQVSHHATLSNMNLTVIAYAPKYTLFGPAIRRFLFIYALYGIIFVGGGAIAYWLSQVMARPLRRLSKLMREVSRGNLDVEFEPEPLGFEINILGERFNETLKALLKNIEQAENEKVKKETYERELTLGRQMQKTLFPTSQPKIKGLSIEGGHVEGTSNFFGWQKKEEKLYFWVCEVSGSGIWASLYAHVFKSRLTANITLHESVAEILQKTSYGDEILPSLASYDSETGKLDYFFQTKMQLNEEKVTGQGSAILRADEELVMQTSEGGVSLRVRVT